MTGVSILAMEEVAIKFAFNWTTFLILLGLALVICSFLVFDIVKDFDFMVAVPVIIFCIIAGCILGVVFGTVFEKPIKYEPHYKVTVTDEVSMTEFMDKYEIIEQEGKIYTVRERD